MAAPPTQSVPPNIHSAFNSIPPSIPPGASAGPSLSQSLNTPGGIHIPANRQENYALAQQLANHQQYLCYQLARYYQCGHPAGSRDLLLSGQHIDKLGYGTACDADCAVDYSRRVINPTRCFWCLSVEECFTVVMRHSCGHLAGVQSSGGQTHAQRLGLQTPCDAWCRSVQVFQDVGGACVHCTFGHCCMIWEKYRCGHRGGVVGNRVVGPHHIINLGSDLVPCDPRCRFKHKERDVGDKCPRCKPMYTGNEGNMLQPIKKVRW